MKYFIITLLTLVILINIPFWSKPKVYSEDKKHSYYLSYSFKDMISSCLSDSDDFNLTLYDEVEEKTLFETKMIYDIWDVDDIAQFRNNVFHLMGDTLIEL